MPYNTTFNTENLTLNKISRKQFRQLLSSGTAVRLIYSSNKTMNKYRVVERQQTNAIVFATYDDDGNTRLGNSWLPHVTGDEYYEVQADHWHGVAVGKAGQLEIVYRYDNNAD